MHKIEVHSTAKQVALEVHGKAGGQASHCCCLHGTWVSSGLSLHNSALSAVIHKIAFSSAIVCRR